MIDRLIGNTPLVKLERVIEPEFEVWVKLEGQNPGGSIKDRTALAMVLDAEQRGLLQPGGTIIEPTSGNTGIGLAQVAAARGYKLILCLPAQMSEERKRTLLAYGAELVLTDPKRRMLAAIEEAKKLVSSTPNAWMPNQFENAANPRVHYETTGPELWKQMDGRIDAFVYGTGTGGTISGIGKYLKEQNPDAQIIGIEPARSNVLSGGTRGEHGFQGMGPGFIPPNLERSLLDRVLMIWEEDAFPFARRLAREEGLFIGMSSGANIYAATQVARMLGPGKRVATIACDTGSRYLSTKLFQSETV
jgi:cysteine synthase